MIPAVPNGATADSEPLVTLGDYQRVTGDTVAAPERFDSALTDALGQLQGLVLRTLLYAQYTERLYLYANGQVYPSATPIDVARGVTSPVGGPPEDEWVFRGNGIWLGWCVSVPSLAEWTKAAPPQADITYWGGYVGPTGSGPFLLPASLQRIICRVCWFMLNPEQLMEVESGAADAVERGSPISVDISSLMIADPQLGRDIKRWRHPMSLGLDGPITRAR